MEKIDIQTFKKYKEQIMNVLEIIEKGETIPEEEENKLLNQYKDALVSLTSFELSEIPFEEWDGIYIAPGAFDDGDDKFTFSGTGANLDFNLFNYDSSKEFSISESQKVCKFKGCNVRNFDFTKNYYDEDTFDEEYVRENNVYFLPNELNIDEDIRKRFYSGELSYSDIIKNPEILEYIEKNNLEYGCKEVFDFFGKEEFKRLDFEFLNANGSWVREKIKEIPEEKDASKVMEILYKNAREELLSENSSRFSYINRSNFGKEFMSRNEDLYLSDEVPDYVRNEYYSGYLDAKNLIRYIDYFKDKKYLPFIKSNGNDREIIEKFGDDFIPIFSKYSDLFLESTKQTYYPFNNFEMEDNLSSDEKEKILTDYIVKNIDINGNLQRISNIMGQVDITSRIKDGKAKEVLMTVGIENLLELGYSNLNELENGITDVKTLKKLNLEKDKLEKIIPANIKILENRSIDELDELNITDLSFFTENHLSNLEKLKEEMETYPIDIIPMGTPEQKQFILKYGIDNIIRLDKETGGIFSQKIFGQDNTIYLSLFAEQEKISKKLNDQVNLSYDEFREEIYNDLKSARSRNGVFDRNPNYYDVSYGFVKGDFREKYLNIFLPEEIKDTYFAKLFYAGKLDSEQISINPNYYDILREKDLTNATRTEVNFPGLVTPEGDIMGRAQVNLANFIIENYGVDNYFAICKDYGAKLDNSNLFFSNHELTLDEFRNQIETTIYSRIKDYGEIYNESLPDSFKEKHPELFLSDSVDEGMRTKFYAGTLTLEDIKSHPELREQLSDKDIRIGMSHVVKSQSQYDKNQRMGFLFDAISKDKLFDLAQIYGDYLYGVDFLNINSNMEIDDLRKNVEESIETAILNSFITYGPNVNENFKAKHPELFLDEGTPEEIKLAYYSNYVCEDGEHKGKNASNFTITLERLADDEFNKYLKGKSLANITNREISRLSKYFSTEELIRFSKIDIKALRMYVNLNDRELIKLRRYIDEKPQKFAEKEMLELEGYTEEEVKLINSDEISNNQRIVDGRELLEKKKEKFEKEIISSPGFVLYYSEDKEDKFNFKEYKELLALSKFNVSDNYRRPVAENIIINMYEMFGYNGAKEILKLPNIETSRIEDVLRNHGKKFNEIYEERFLLQGNLKVINTFFDKYNPILKNKKDMFNTYKTINEKLENGFDGTIDDLIMIAFEENGIEADPIKIKACTRSAKEAHVNEKISNIYDMIQERIEGDFVETIPNKKMLKDILISSYKKSLSQTEKLDMELIENIIRKEFSRTKDDGTSFYSPHITSHLQDLMNITQDICQDHLVGKQVNMTIVDVFKDEKGKIGKGWLRKLNSLSSELSKEELEKLTTYLYGENENSNIQTVRRLELKDKSEKGIEEAYVLLKEMEYPGVFTYEKGEQMFVGLAKPYSEEFAKYFMKKHTDFLRKPEFYTKFQKMNSEFDRIIQDPYVSNRYKAGTYTMNELLDAINRTVYEGVKDGEYDLEYNARKGGIEKEYFSRAQEVFHEMEERESQTIPPIEFNGKKYRGRILRIDDPLHLAIGNVTTCCQRFGNGQPGEPSMVHSAVEENGSVFIVEEIDDFGRPKEKIVSQSWTWRNGDRICFDNVEIPDTLHEELRQTDGFDQILEIYRCAAEKMIQIDRTSWQKLLEEGRVSQDEYDKYVLKDVTVGTGCDDLIRNISEQEKSKLKKPDTMIRVIEGQKTYKTVSGINREPWVDSDATQLVLATNDEEITKRKETGKIQIPIAYKKVRETIRRNGSDISPDIIRRVSKINERNNTLENNFFNRISNGKISNLYGSFEEFLDEEHGLNISLSNDDDWYIFVEDTPNALRIEESSVTQDDSQSDSAISKMEYEEELITLFEKANEENKKIEIMQQQENPIINQLVQDNLISINGRSITITDTKKIEERRKKLSDEIISKKDQRILDRVEKKDDSDER